MPLAYLVVDRKMDYGNLRDNHLPNTSPLHTNPSLDKSEPLRLTAPAGPDWPKPWNWSKPAAESANGPRPRGCWKTPYRPFPATGAGPIIALTRAIMGAGSIRLVMPTPRKPVYGGSYSEAALSRHMIIIYL